MYLEELRQESLKKTIEMVRELENSDPNKLKQIYMYKVLTEQEYDEE